MTFVLFVAAYLLRGFRRNLWRGDKQMNIQGNALVSRKITLFSILAIVVVVCGVYANSLNGFVNDDEIIIESNPTTHHLGSIGDVVFSLDVIKPCYRPLNRASYLIDYRLFGHNPMWFHAVNIFIHLMNALLLYLIARRLFQDRNAALFAALLFAIHPANTEAVNFISARHSLPALCFSPASRLSFLKVREKGVRWPLLSAIRFFAVF